MSMTFTKLFSSITESTIWSEDANTRLTWITMLAMADRRGRVWGSIPGLANRARVPVDACENALKIFLSPDKYSRTTDHEGRKIEEIDGGWRLLNYLKYRDIRDQESVKEKTAERVRKHREKKRNVTLVTLRNDNEEAEAEEDKNKKGWLLPEWVDPASWAVFEAHRKEMKRGLTDAARTLNANVLVGLSPADQSEIVSTTIKSGWSGLFPLKGKTNEENKRSLSAPDRVRAANAKRNNVGSTD